INPDGELALWNVETRKCLFDLQLGFVGGNVLPVVSADGRTMIGTRGNSRNVLVREWELGQIERRKELGDRLKRARERLRARPDDPEALLTLAEWSAAWEKWDWAAEFVEAARKAGARNAGALILARHHWLRSRREQLRAGLIAVASINPVLRPLAVLSETIPLDVGPDPDLTAAEREFGRALAAATDPAEQAYLRICLEAVRIKGK
ncbi:MAG TPA: hypothetical protein VM597_22065, partial [Gemmataceae bacterium]|nr:hypothetical protein [Gemmataceae bacterium]